MFFDIKRVDFSLLPRYMNTHDWDIYQEMEEIAKFAMKRALLSAAMDCRRQDIADYLAKVGSSEPSAQDENVMEFLHNSYEELEKQIDVLDKEMKTLVVSYEEKEVMEKDEGEPDTADRAADALGQPETIEEVDAILMDSTDSSEDEDKENESLIFVEDRSFDPGWLVILIEFKPYTIHRYIFQSSWGQNRGGLPGRLGERGKNTPGNQVNWFSRKPTYSQIDELTTCFIDRLRECYRAMRSQGGKPCNKPKMDRSS
jgi:hypothetical protein